MNFIKTAISYLFIFLLFYFEPEEIGPITFSQLWKIPLFVYLVWKVLIFKKNRKLTFIKWSYARASKNLLNGGFFLNYFVEVVDFIRYMMFPLMFEFVSNKIKDIKKLDYLLLAFAQFVILSGIPFVLGIISSRGRKLYELDDFESYTGVFQGPHSASITTAIAVLVILSFLKFKSPQILYPKLNYLLATFGLYLLFLTYVRTGYAMFVVGIIILYIPQKPTMKQILGSVIILGTLVFGFVYLLENNEFFYNRIFDIRNNQETALGSGRLIFWEAAFDLWANGNYFQLFFGHGFEGLTQKIYEVTGLRIYAHNEFFTQLGQNGLLGIFLLFGYIMTLFKFIRRYKKKKTYPLALSVFALYISLMITQGGMWFPLDIFMVLIFVKLYREPKIIKVKNILLT